MSDTALYPVKDLKFAAVLLSLGKTLVDLKPDQELPGRMVFLFQHEEGMPNLRTQYLGRELIVEPYGLFDNMYLLKNRSEVAAGKR